MKKPQKPKDVLRKIRKPRSIHKPEQVHKDKRRSYEDNKDWQREIEDDINDYYTDKQD